jgi:thiamine-monophosphate kinase
VNLSDLAAKGAEPWGYFLTTAWPTGTSWADKALFAEGLAVDGQAFDISLLGGDTVSTPGPLTLTATLLGWVPQGGAIPRKGGRPGDRLAVSGVIGDGWLGLMAARGELDSPALADRYRLPEPRVDLIPVLRAHARAAADVSDGLLADAGHIARASGCGVRIEFDAMPLSPEALAWLKRQPAGAEALTALATGGDDYQIVCALDAAIEVPAGLTVIGRFVEGQGVIACVNGGEIEVPRLGWTHA